jgi:hypothetical protein
VSRQDLLPHPTNRQDAPAQGDFTCHADISQDFTGGKGRDERAGNGNARAGAILRNGALGDMDVDVHLVEDVEINFHLSRRVYVRKSSLGDSCMHCRSAL